MTKDPQDPIDLNLGSNGHDNGKDNNAEDAVYHSQQGEVQINPDKGQVIGWVTVASGVLGLFTLSIFFVPLTLICSIIAIFMGRGLWAFFGIVLAVLGFLTSPTLLGIVGLAALAAYFGF